MARQLKGEASLLKACTDLLSAERIWFRRWNTGAVKTDNRFFRFGKKGDADILATPVGDGFRRGTESFTSAIRERCDFIVPKILWIECKSNSGSQTKEQAEFQKQVTEIGHWYLLIRDVDELRAWLREHGAIGGIR